MKGLLKEDAKNLVRYDCWKFKLATKKHLLRHETLNWPKSTIVVPVSYTSNSIVSFLEHLNKATIHRGCLFRSGRADKQKLVFKIDNCTKKKIASYLY